MSGIGTGTALGALRFQRNLSFLSGAGSAGISLNATGEVLAVLASETAPFPAGEIELGKIHVEAETPKPIEFGNGSGKISFTAKGSAFAGFRRLSGFGSRALRDCTGGRDRARRPVRQRSRPEFRPPALGVRRQS